MPGWITPVLAVVVIVVALVVTCLRVVSQYERGVVFRLGRLRPIYGPGLRIVIPTVDRLERVDLRIVTLTIPPQEIITKDNVPARVNAVVLFNVVDPEAAIMKVENYAVATSQIAQTTLRSVLGRADLDTLLAHRDDLNNDLREIIELQTKPWGVDVSVVEIKDVEIPEQMQRAMAKEAEAERERRAKIINARGELQASAELKQAADMLSQSPASLQLRYLQTLLELGADQNSTVVFPLPMDIIGPMMTRLAGETPPASALSTTTPPTTAPAPSAPEAASPAPEAAPTHAATEVGPDASMPLTSAHPT